MSKDKAPPLLSYSKSYEDWKKFIDLLRGYTSVQKNKQTSAIVFSLEGNAQTAALDVSNTDLTKDDVVDTLLPERSTDIEIRSYRSLRNI